MSPDEAKGLAAVAVAIVTMLGGVLTSRRTADKEKEKVETGPVPVQTAALQLPLADRLDSDGLSAFLTAIVNENGAQRERLALVEQKVADLQKEEAHFRGALGRWVTRIYASWGRQDAMPMPDGDDYITLRDVLPR